MISRDKLQSLTEALHSEYNSPKKKIEREAAKEEVANTNMTWGGRESSMIDAKDMPNVLNMIQRLKSKYASEFERRLGTNTILKEIEDFIKAELRALKNETPPDNDKIWQHEVMLRLFTEPFHAGPYPYNKSYFHPETSDLFVHEVNLKELLAYLWIAATDFNATLRPQYERLLNQEKNPEARQEAKVKLIRDLIRQYSLFNLWDIRREHSEDHAAGKPPEYKNSDEYKRLDYPSCLPGTLGRLVFRFCPGNAVTAVVSENLTVAEIEKAAIAAAAASEEVDLLCIPNEIENFIIEILGAQLPETQKAIYRCFTFWILDAQDKPDANASIEDKNAFAEKEKLFEKDKTVFGSFLQRLAFLSETSLLEHLAGKIKSLQIDQHTREKIIEMYNLVLIDLEPESLFHKSIGNIYTNKPDMDLIERIRKKGAALIQQDRLEHTTRQDEAVVTNRRSIRELRYQFEAYAALIINEVHRALLAHYTITDRRTWDKVNYQISVNITVFKERITRILGPKLESLAMQLKEEINKRKLRIEQDIGFDTLVTQTNLDKIMNEATRTTKRCGVLLKAMNDLMDLLSDLQNDCLQQAAKHDDFKTLTGKQTEHKRKLEAVMAANAGAFTRENDLLVIEWQRIVLAWAKVITQVAGSDQAGKKRELSHLNALLSACYGGDNFMRERLREEICSSIRNIPTTKWREAIEVIQANFPFVPANSLASTAIIPLYKGQTFVAGDFIQVLFDKNIPFTDKNFLIAQLKAYLSPPHRADILKSFADALTARMRYTVNWQEVRDVVRILSVHFTDSHSMSLLGINYNAIISFEDYVKRGESLLGEKKAQAYLLAETPLTLGTLQAGRVNRTPPEVFCERYSAWYDMAADILNCRRHDLKISEVENILATNSPEKDHLEHKINQLSQFVVLTVCRNLQLTDIRFADIETLHTLCRMYLTRTHSQLLFPQEAGDNLSERLHCLTLHLATTLTTLGTIPTLYNIGHVRIMDYAAAHKFFTSVAYDKAQKNQGVIVRTSLSTPTTLSVTEIENGKIGNDQLPSAVISVRSLEFTPRITIPALPATLQKHEITCRLFNEADLESQCRNSFPQMALVPYRQAVVARDEIRHEYILASNRASIMYTGGGLITPSWMGPARQRELHEEVERTITGLYPGSTLFNSAAVHSSSVNGTEAAITNKC